MEEKNKQEWTENVVAYIPDDEEYSYRAAPQPNSEAAREEATIANSYGDFVVEEFSTTSLAPHFTKLVKLPHNLTSYLFAVIFVTFGILCVAITAKVQLAFPYIVGGVMIFYGLVKLVVGIINKEYREEHTNGTIASVIFIALGIMIIVEDYDWDMVFIAVVWGVIGLIEGAHALKRAFDKILKGQRCVYYILKGCVELVLAFLLLHDFEHISTHIIVFGVQLIFDGITMLPQVRRLRHYF
jgi:uncharacterized membrane protein HdeD (DUF308 family)